MITTKIGDNGKSQCQGKMVDKDSIVLEAIGTLDELQAGLMWLGEKEIVGEIRKIMGKINSDLSLKRDVFKIKQLEKKIRIMEKGLKINKFLEFDKKRAIEFNWVRTVSRRAERRVVSLNKKQKINQNILIYLNRLSDYLFLRAVKEN